MHFNYSDPRERDMALNFRKMEVPFKVYDVPEVVRAGELWTDDYLAHKFGSRRDWFTSKIGGTVQESVNNYFAFFNQPQWNIFAMGLPPTRNNDWSFRQWAEHARYADAVQLAVDQPHFYFQTGVEREERYKPKSEWSFVSLDLPSFSDTKANFFQFNPEEQKGIQCRFGERQVVAATHFDGGRNMVAMMTGAKRYILSPPNQCSKLGIFTQKNSAIFRHSLLNFAHIKYMDGENEMSTEEKAWLQRAASSKAVETVLKAGEVLYIPSHWFHYIVSLQKSAQCNVRSGVDVEGNPKFGNRDSVAFCRDEE